MSEDKNPREGHMEVPLPSVESGGRGENPGIVLLLPVKQGSKECQASRTSQAEFKVCEKACWRTV